MEDASKRSTSDRPENARSRKRMRPTLASLVAGYTTITSDIAFMLLAQVEVRDAMSFAIAAANHPEWSNIRRIMQEDRIWLFWLKRDMPAVFGDGTRPKNYVKNIREEMESYAILELEEEIETEADNIKSDTPIAKTVYLWCRLAVSIWQFEIIQMYNRFVGDDEENKIFMGTPSFQYLNVVSFSNGDAVDFGEFFVPMLEFDKPLGFHDAEKVLKLFNTNNFSVFNETGVLAPSTQFFTKKYPTMVLATQKKYMDVVSGLLKPFPFPKTGANIYLPTTYPRLVEKTRLIVASPICARCLEEATHMCAQCRAPYCSQECQVEDWHAGHRGFCE